MVNEPTAKGAVGKYQAWIFFALTLITAFITSQAIFRMNLDIYNTVEGSAVYLLYILCLAIFAAIMLAVFQGGEGLSGLARGWAKWNVGVQWYIVAIVTSLIVEGLTTALFIVAGNNMPASFTLAPLSPVVTAYIIIAAIGLVTGLGYVFSVMLEAHGPIVSATAAGIFLVIYKGFVSYNDPNLLIMSIGLFTLAFLLVWLYNYAKNSLLVMAIFLVMYVYMANLITYGLVAGSGTALPIYINKIIYIFVTAAIVALDMGFFFEKRPSRGKEKATPPDN